MQSKFFLGANSKDGFYSLYQHLIDLQSAQAVYIIKGSPGCGKSSFMRKIEERLNTCGYRSEQILCSSDPDSLDGVIFPELNVAFVDGTSPHIVEPAYPIAVEHYINLGIFIDRASLIEKKREIIDTTNKYKNGYPRIYSLLSAVGTIENELLNIALGGIDISRLHKKAAGIASREIRGSGSCGKLKPRFLSSISSKGYTTLFESALCENLYVIDDNFGLAPFLLKPIADAAVSAGFCVYAAYSPLNPTKLEHLIIPELDLSFVTSKKYSAFTGDYKRHIRLDAMIDADLLRDKKKKISFLRKLMQSTLTEAYSALGELKLIHDELEALYNPYVNFDAIYEKANYTANTLI